MALAEHEGLIAALAVPTGLFSSASHNKFVKHK